MLSARALWPRVLIGLFTPILVGCSDPYAGRREVTGTVTLEGEPLKTGIILFTPLDGQDTQGSTPLANGEYRITRVQGLKPGKYLVRITAGDGKTPTNSEIGQPGGNANIVSWDLIPDDFGYNSKQQVEVKADAENRFDFPIPKANTPRRRYR
jgi:hypothetical protein